MEKDSWVKSEPLQRWEFTLPSGEVKKIIMTESEFYQAAFKILGDMDSDGLKTMEIAEFEDLKTKARRLAQKFYTPSMIL